MSQPKINDSGSTDQEMVSVGTETLVHEYTLKFKEDIQEQIKAGEKKAETIEIEDESYILPERIEPGEERTYGVNLVNRVLEEHRPSKYPPRTPAVWAFAGWPGETQMSRRGAITLDTEAVLSDHTLYAVDFEVAANLFMQAMQEMNFGAQISKSFVDNNCEKYWEEVSQVKTVADLPTTLSEVYIPTGSLSADYYDTIYISRDGENYTTYKE